MKGQVIVLVLALFLASAGVCFAGDPLFNTDFQGSITRTSSGNTVFESRLGTWQDEFDGRFSGQAVLNKTNSDNWYVYKYGAAKNGVFDGVLEYLDKVVPGSHAYTVTRSGKEKIEGGTFDGRNYTSNVSYSNGESEYTVEKNGVINTEAYSGSLKYTENRKRDNTLTVNETRSGKEEMEGGVFTGTKTVTTTCGALRTVKSGTLRTPTFSGSIDYVELRGGDNFSAYKSWDKNGYEQLPEGGLFIGRQQTIRGTNGISVIKEGQLKTAGFTGRLQYRYDSEFAGPTSSYDMRTGTWRIDNKKILTGTLTVTTAGDTVTVTDNRK